MNLQQLHRFASLLGLMAVFVLVVPTIGQASAPEKNSFEQLVLTAQQQAWLKAHPTIRLAPDIAWPPFEWVNSEGQYQGIAADYMQLVENKLGIRFEVEKNKPWSEVVEAVKERKLDVFSCVAKNPQRLGYVNFTRPYLSFPMVIITSDRIDYIDGIKGLRGNRVGVVKGYATHEYLEANHPEITLHIVKTTEQGLEAVSQGKADAFVDNIASATTLIHKKGLTNLKISGEMPIRYELGIAVRKDWPELIEILQQALDSITDEQRRNIHNKWIGVRYEHGFDYGLLWKSLVVFILIVGLMYFYQRKLSQEINRRKISEIRELGDKTILEMIAKGGSLSRILEAVVMHVETLLKGANCSVLLLGSSGKSFETGIAPGLPDYYNKALNGLKIGMGVGSCGQAAYTGKRVIVADIMTHPNWEPFRDLVKRTHLRACWSQPLSSSDGTILGAFAIYYSEVREPDEYALKVLSEISQFAAIAVEKNKSQQQLIDARVEAENSNRAKSEFLSSMSHELRTPMNAILGFSQLLQMEELNKVQMDNVSEIYKAGNHLLELINEVLDLSKIEAGQIDLSIDSVALENTIEECLSLVVPIAEQNCININVDHASCDEVVVRADATRLRQVLLNLLSNAIKYNRQGGQIYIYSEPQPDNTVCIKVKDTGPGITQENQTALFTAFSRLGAEQTEVEGTGIGLMITKQLVELMGGTVGIESTLGEGSIFWITLPRDEIATASKAELKAKKPDQLIHTGDDFSILYVEDNPSNLMLVSRLLGSRAHIKLHTAHTPQLGLDLIMSRPFDLILLDINLPGMSGYEIVERIRENEKTKNIPTIAVSANAMEKDIEKGMAAGFNEYLTKPINVDAFYRAIDGVLNRDPNNNN